MKKLQDEPDAGPEGVDTVEEQPQPVTGINDDVVFVTNELKIAREMAASMKNYEQRLVALGAELADVRELEKRLTELRPAREIQAEIEAGNAELRAAIAARDSLPALEAKAKQLGKGISSREVN
jgi:hypothetical protein